MEPERFYHGFLLGMMVELADKYVLTSNRESSIGRYDVMLEPKQEGADAFIMEFKVQDPEDEKELSDTVKNALDQIERSNYEAVLVVKGIPRERIRKYGFAFCGKRVLIRSMIEQEKSPRCMSKTTARIRLFRLYFQEALKYSGKKLSK